MLQFRQLQYQRVDVRQLPVRGGLSTLTWQAHPLPKKLRLQRVSRLSPFQTQLQASILRLIGVVVAACPLQVLLLRYYRLSQMIRKAKRSGVFFRSCFKAVATGVGPRLNFPTSVAGQYVVFPREEWKTGCS